MAVKNIHSIGIGRYLLQKIMHLPGFEPGTSAVRNSAQTTVHGRPQDKRKIREKY